MKTADVRILRELARRYMEICGNDIQNERRDMWRKHNSLQDSRIPIICSWYSGSNLAGSLLVDECVCEDAFFRGYELNLRNMIYNDSIGDDTVAEPWLTVRAEPVLPAQCRNGATWGLPYERREIPEAQAWTILPSISSIENLSRLVATPHGIDEAATTRKVAKLQDAVGDIIEVDVDRSPHYTCYVGSDLCEALGYLVGIENLMIYMHEKPELIHGIVRFMRNAVLEQFDEAETAGDWGLSNGTNMGMPYAEDLKDPAPNRRGAAMKELWFFTCAQAFTLVSPQMFEEFMLQYQKPIMAKFGLVSYACCEDVTTKIDALKAIPNLRRIGIPPICDVRKCAEQIQRDYVFAWKPNPAMVCCGFDADDIRKTMQNALEASKGCVVDIMLKDVTTIQGRPERLKAWTDIVRRETEKI